MLIFLQTDNTFNKPYTATLGIVVSTSYVMLCYLLYSGFYRDNYVGNFRILANETMCSLIDLNIKARLKIYNDIQCPYSFHENLSMCVS